MGRDDSSRVLYDSTHNIVGDSFCQSMYKRPFMLNYQGVQLPGLENAEARAQWIVALHVPYIGVGGLSELYAQGYAKDANKPWAAALAVGNALLDMAVTDMVKPPVGVVDTATGCGDAVASSGSQSCKGAEEKKEDVLPATSMGATVPGGGGGAGASKGVGRAAGPRSSVGCGGERGRVWCFQEPTTGQ